MFFVALSIRGLIMWGGKGRKGSYSTPKKPRRVVQTTRLRRFPKKDIFWKLLSSFVFALSKSIKAISCLSPLLLQTVKSGTQMCVSFLRSKISFRGNQACTKLPSPPPPLSTIFSLNRKHTKKKNCVTIPFTPWQQQERKRNRKKKSAFRSCLLGLSPSPFSILCLAVVGFIAVSLSLPPSP